MKVYRSNRVERLLEALVEVVRQPLSDPLRPEHVVVHSRGMAVWLQQQLALRLGVWTGGAFPFPRRFVHDCFRVVLGDDAVDAFDQQHLVWSIATVLPGHLGEKGFAELRRFLSDDPRGTKLFELAARIADRFDQYVVYRPDLVLGWEAGEGSDWQAVLWRSLARARASSPRAPTHAAALASRLIARLQAPTFDASCLPERVCVFGVGSLPPFHVKVLAALAVHCPVHLFLPSPSREYWAELRSHRELLREVDEPGLHAFEDETGPSLLRSLGTVGRDFQRILEAEVDYEEPMGDLYVEPTAATLLASLQRDLLHMRRPSPEDSASRHVVEPDDASISIMACHSPMREVEVLHDRILDMLVADPSLEPRDIVVMMSDVDTYAPLVEAVFAREPDRDAPTFVPFSVADRSVRGESPMLEAFHRITALVGGRVTASEVLDLLALDALQRRFELEPEDVDTLSQWISESGVRWGIDADHRRKHGQPPVAQNTWRFGLDRLLLGYALRGDGRETFAGVLPHDEIEGQSTALLGTLAGICSRLFENLGRLEAPRPVQAWPEALGALLDDMLVREDQGAWEVEPLRAALESIVADAAQVGHRDAVPLAVMCNLIDARIEEDRPPRGFLAGGVTFCAVLPMRTIPFRVVCLLGMGDTQFPRSARSVGFDLMRQHPRPGDRSRRLDDRYSFLEALMAARERVLISYVGQSIQDNAVVPPSVVVSELLDHFAESAIVRGSSIDLEPEQARAAIEARLVVRHPMQPFSPRYFGADEDARLFSFARTWREGAEALRQGSGVGRSEHAPLLVRRLPPPRDSVRELPLSHLERFFHMPAAELLKRRLRVNLSDYSRDRSDREPMELGGLDEWRVGTNLIEHRLDAVPAERSLELLRASGALPHGVPGACRHEVMWRAADPIVETVRPLLDAGREPSLDIDLEIGGTRLVGVLGHRYAGGLVTWQYARVTAKTMLDAWIRHLVHAALAPSELPTTVVARGERGGGATTLRLHPVRDPMAHLQDLVELYRIGQCEPLLLFPRSSLALCRALAADKPLEAALDEARKVWAGHFNAEGREPHLARLFADADVLQPGYRPFEDAVAPDFPTLSDRVFAPILRHEVKP
jgi:exodeoxyribonuclease V gamma subunit